MLITSTWVFFNPCIFFVTTMNKHLELQIWKLLVHLFSVNTLDNDQQVKLWPPYNAPIQVIVHSIPLYFLFLIPSAFV